MKGALKGCSSGNFILSYFSPADPAGIWRSSFLASLLESVIFNIHKGFIRRPCPAWCVSRQVELEEDRGWRQVLKVILRILPLVPGAWFVKSQPRAYRDTNTELAVHLIDLVILTLTVIHIHIIYCTCNCCMHHVHIQYTDIDTIYIT